MIKSSERPKNSNYADPLILAAMIGFSGDASAQTAVPESSNPLKPEAVSKICKRRQIL
jgi:hypothetical protein